MSRSVTNHQRVALNHAFIDGIFPSKPTSYWGTMEVSPPYEEVFPKIGDVSFRWSPNVMGECHISVMSLMMPWDWCAFSSRHPMRGESLHHLPSGNLT